MKKNLTLFGLLLCASTLVAQYAIEWKKNYGGSDWENGTSVQLASDGGYYVFGKTSSMDGDLQFIGTRASDFWVMKLKPSGTIQWSKVFGGSGEEYLRKGFLSNDGGFFLVGATNSTDGDITDSIGQQDIWLVKLNAQRTIAWQKTLGGTKYEYLPFALPTPDNGYLLIGTTLSDDGVFTENKGVEDGYVIKIDSLGDVVWQHTFGGSNSDFLTSGALTDDGGYMILGYTDSNDGDINFNHGYQDVWILKLDANGELIWEKTIGGSHLDFTGGIKKNDTGGYFVTAHSYSNDGDFDANYGAEDGWLLKLDELGGIVWKKNFGGSSTDYIGGINFINQGFVFAGASFSRDGDVGNNYGPNTTDIWLLQTDTLGNVVWHQNYGGSQVDFPGALMATPDNGFILVGRTESADFDVENAHGGEDMWVLKFNQTVHTEEPTSQLKYTLETFPNPSAGMVAITAHTDDTSISVKLFDQLGRKVIEKLISNGGQLNLSTLTPGVYTVMALDEHGRAFLGKITLAL